MGQSPDATNRTTVTDEEDPYHPITPEVGPRPPPSRRSPGGIGKGKRHAATERKRARLLERDGNKCWICGRDLTVNPHGNRGNRPTFDHIIPRSRGGGNELENLRLACLKCNGKRGDTPAEEVRTYREDGWT